MVTLRPALPEDAEALAAIYAPHVLAGTVSFETVAPDAATMRERMAASAGLYPWIVAADAGADAGDVLGYAYATRFSERAAYRWAVETTIYIAAGAQGRGLGQTLYAALLATLRAQGFTQAMARIALPNPPSIALHRTLGFRHAGDMRAIGWKAGAWIDVGYWQCALAAPEVPDEPRRFADVSLVAP